ncbi:MAG: hypothetical protein IJE95_07940 [Methanocorpusculum sp.]|nr:hypothetical protein [Methanocorpusculum sp.]
MPSPSTSVLTDFADDQLNREYLADYLTTFIRTTLPAVNTNSLVLALNSAWGSGKTSFIQMWINKLKKTNVAGTDTNTKSGDDEDVIEPKQEFNIIYYNAWENDSCPEAIIPIICSFSQLLETSVTEKDKSEKRKEVILNTLKTLGPRVLNAVACGVLHIDSETGREIASCITDSVSESLTTDLPRSIYDAYSSTQEKKNAFKDLAKEFATEDKPLLIFIDELDRCRPTFAIETLESVKHFFDLPNVIFVFSLDSTQLKKSIQAVYGEIDSVGYLQRFFDYEISLPEANDLQIFLSSRLCFEERNVELEMSQLKKITRQLSLSLRDLNVICLAYMKFLKAKPYLRDAWQYEEIEVYRRVYITLIALKYKDPLQYLNMLTSGLTEDDMMNSVWRELFGYREQPFEADKNTLTRRLLETDIRQLMMSNKNSEQGFLFHRVLLKEDWEMIKLNQVNFTLSRAIMNNVDSGVIHHSMYHKEERE